MRFVAVALVALVALLSPMPASALNQGTLGAYDECADRLDAPHAINATQRAFCLRLDNAQQDPSGGQRLKSSYYLWFGWLVCRDFTASCAGSPPFTTSPHLVSVLYQDDNGLAGLQRAKITNVVSVADTTILA